MLFSGLEVCAHNINRKQKGFEGSCSSSEKSMECRILVTRMAARNIFEEERTCTLSHGKS